MHPVVRGNLSSRTSRAALALILIGAAEQALPTFVIDLIPERYEGAALALLGAVMLLLRNITTKPIAQRGAKK